MPKTIVQQIVFKNTKPATLYELYMNAKKHALVTNAPATITAKEGSKFSAHGDHISGKNLQLIKNKLIVQSWRGNDWNKNDTDSTLIMLFEQKGEDVVVYATHANVPDNHEQGINNGWHKHYWDHWKKYLAGKSIVATKM